MRIIGVEVAGGTPVFSLTLAHGADPHRLAWERGYRIVRPLSVTGLSPDLSATVQLARHGKRVHRPGSNRARAVDPGLALGPDASLVVRQRLAAYAIVFSPQGILATEFSEKTAVPGLWGLPGGGITDGETAAAAVAREVTEETGQTLEIDHLLDLQTDHWIGRSPTSLIEDFHAVRILFAGHCLDPAEPVVHDVGGTTASAEWVPLARWHTTPWAASTRALLERHMPGLRDAWLRTERNAKGRPAATGGGPWERHGISDGSMTESARFRRRARPSSR